MSCDCGVVIPQDAPGVSIISPKLKADDYARVELKCTRPDEHPLEGNHWWEHDGMRLAWTVSRDTVWMAGNEADEVKSGASGE